MYRSVNRPDGTAYASSLLIDGARMSGKTGTVQVRRISKDERLTGVIPNSKLDWHLRDHSLFVGYVPHNNPRYAVSVVIEHGGGGGRSQRRLRGYYGQLLKIKILFVRPSWSAKTILRAS